MSADEKEVAKDHAAISSASSIGSSNERCPGGSGTRRGAPARAAAAGCEDDLLLACLSSFSRLAIAFFSLAFSIALNGLSLSRKLPSSAARTAVATRPPRRSRAAMSARMIRRMFQPPESDSRRDDAREQTDARGARTRDAIEEFAVKSAMAVRSLIRR